MELVGQCIEQLEKALAAKTISTQNSAPITWPDDPADMAKGPLFAGIHRQHTLEISRSPPAASEWMSPSPRRGPKFE
jgi:hypothetical protein